MQDLMNLYRLLVYLTSLTVCSGDNKKSSENEKKPLKMTSQLVIFRAFFFFFPISTTPNLEKIPVNQLIQTSGLSKLRDGDSVKTCRSG